MPEPQTKTWRCEVCEREIVDEEVYGPDPAFVPAEGSEESAPEILLKPLSETLVCTGARTVHTRDNDGKLVSFNPEHRASQMVEVE